MNPTMQKTLVFPRLEKDKVNRTGEYHLDASGKGVNVARVLTQLGKSCYHLTQLGGFFRPLFLDLCREDGLSVEWVESYSPIRFCYTVLDQHEKTVTELVEESEKVEEKTGDRLLEKYKELITGSSTLIISGTKAEGFNDNLIPEMVRMAKEKNLLVILDIRGNDLINCLPYRPDIIKPNLNEFLSTFAPEIHQKNIKNAVQEIWAGLYEKYHCSLILTNGSEPLLYAERDELSEYSPCPADQINSTGSGDAFTAGLAAALEEGASFIEAIAQSAKCGALNAAHLRPGVIK